MSEAVESRRGGEAAPGREVKGLNRNNILTI